MNTQRKLMATIAAGVLLLGLAGSASANQAREDVLAYLKSLGRGSYLFGQVATWVDRENPDMDDSSNWIKKVQDHTGNLPGYGCITYSFAQYPDPSSDAAYNEGVKKMWDRGMIVGIYSFFANPGGGAWNAPVDFENIWAPGENAIKTNFYGQLDRMAANLQWLKDRGIPVVYTPFVESDDGNKWHAKKGSAAVIQLYQLVHDYFQTTKQLDNIIWAYHTTQIGGNLQRYYPGDAYVDVLGKSAYGLSLPFDGDYAWVVEKKQNAGKVIWWAELGIRNQADAPRDCFDVLRKLEQSFPELAGFVFWLDGTYWNVIGNLNGPQFMADPRIVTLTHPTITAQPANATVNPGQTAPFSVTAYGTAPLAYQWYKNNAVIGGATASSYTTPATTTNDNGAAFQVTVTNAYGAVTSSVATLTVIVAPTGTVVATGGTVTNYTLNGTNWTAHIFTTVGTTNLNFTSGGNVEVLVVGGGGGGGRNGAGGGAGGLVYSNGFGVVAGEYTIIVGSGGVGSWGAGNSNSWGADGTNSSFSSIVATGGGGGGGLNQVGRNGGSGGGGGGSKSAPRNSGGTNVVGQGNMGGAGGVLSLSWGGGGGGGGAGGAGYQGGDDSNGGNGGVGLFFSQFVGLVSSTVGTTKDGWFAGGGGGGEVGGTIASTGGRGGGGNTTLQMPGSAGTVNTGGGGGGGSYYNGASPSWIGADKEGAEGGSGIVIVRYVTGGGLDPFEAWRQTSFTSAQLTNAAISSATADPDKDGLNNEQEYLAGTNPTNALSCLVIYAATNNPSADEKFVIRWQSVSSKMYKVMAATNLLIGFADLATNIQATPAVNVHTDSVGSAETKFYRVKLE